MLAKRTAQIAAIIEQRRPLAGRIEKSQENLRKISAEFQSLEVQRDLIIAQVEADIGGRLRDIDLATIQRKIVAELDSLEKLKRRFSRTTFNIGVVGRARQGKSR